MIRLKAEKALRDLACLDKELSILFTDDAQIAELNERYLGRKGPTNVLAFPMAEGEEEPFETSMLGDVVISVDTAVREAKETGEPLDLTLDRLLVHGILHLLGFDHEESGLEAQRMEREERRLVAVIREE